MNKILFLFTIIIFNSCSSGEEMINDNLDNNGDDSPPQPKNIEFTVHELWKSKLVWDSNNIITQRQKWCGEEDIWVSKPSNGGVARYGGLTGFHTGVSQHFSLDTLVIELQSNVLGKKTNFFDFNIQRRGDIRNNPKRIGHIEFVKVDENSKIKIYRDYIVNQTVGGTDIFPIEYFTSNLEEDFITSITLDGDSSGHQRCENIKAFEKVDTSESFRKTTEIKVVVAYDNDNRNLKIGDSIGRSGYSSKRLGEGWDENLITII